MLTVPAYILCVHVWKEHVSGTRLSKNWRNPPVTLLRSKITSGWKKARGIKAVPFIIMDDRWYIYKVKCSQIGYAYSVYKNRIFYRTCDTIPCSFFLHEWRNTTRFTLDILNSKFRRLFSFFRNDTFCNLVITNRKKWLSHDYREKESRFDTTLSYFRLPILYPK